MIVFSMFSAWISSWCVIRHWSGAILFKGRTIQPKLDRTDPVKSATSESAIQYRSDTDTLAVTFHGPWENIRPLANESVKHCLGRGLAPYQVASWSMQPFGCDRYGPKIVAGSPSNTMWPGLRPTHMPSFILIHPAVWPQCTNVTDSDRQTGQWSDIVLLRFQNVSCRSVSVGFAEKNLGFRFGLGFRDKCVVNFIMTRVIWHDFHHR